MCENPRGYRCLNVKRTLRQRVATCGTRRKPEQKQPPDRRTMCGLLSCHRTVVLPASLLCALHVTRGHDTVRKPLAGLIAVFPGRSGRRRWVYSSRRWYLANVPRRRRGYRPNACCPAVKRPNGRRQNARRKAGPRANRVAVAAQRTVLHLSQLLEIIATGGRAQPTYGKGRSADCGGALLDQAV